MFFDSLESNRSPTRDAEFRVSMKWNRKSSLVSVNL